MAEYLHNEDGGFYCGECGCFHDDYYDTKPLLQCPECGAILKDTDKYVDSNYMLCAGATYCDKKEYPKWLLDLRKQHERR